MKATGIVRRMDDLGRITIPKETRKTLGWNAGDPLELYINTKERAVVFKKYQVADEYDAEAVQRILNAIFIKGTKWVVFVRGDLLATNDIRFPDDLDAIDPDLPREEFSVNGDDAVLIVSNETPHLPIAKSVVKAFLLNE
jgi:AbrB family looped-hinge helix DNA binding protein